jgi:hypothetical protein
MDPDGAIGPRRSSSVMASILFCEKGAANGCRGPDFFGVLTDTAFAT